MQVVDEKVLGFLRDDGILIQVRIGNIDCVWD